MCGYAPGGRVDSPDEFHSSPDSCESKAIKSPLVMIPVGLVSPSRMDSEVGGQSRQPQPSGPSPGAPGTENLSFSVQPPPKASKAFLLEVNARINSDVPFNSISNPYSTM